MTSRVIDTDGELDALIAFIRNHKRPFTVSVTKGRKRSVEQNRLQRLWMNEVSEQKGDETPEEVRAYCKLTIGVPLLRAENEEFAEAYDKHIKPLPYETKLACMMEPLDFPVTRLMSTDQHARYLDSVLMHWLGQGYKLTLPEEGE